MNLRPETSVGVQAMRVAPLCLSVLLLSSGCVVHETRPLPPPMSDAEAVQRGESWCTSHGYGCRPRRVGRRADVVEVVFDAEGHGAQGPLRLEFGTWDRRLLRVEVPAVPPPGPRPAEESEVLQAGAAWCRSRGYVCVLLDSHVEGQSHWVLRYRVQGARRGEVGLTYDAFSRALLGVRENVHG
jgi:hypothetical protein